MQICVVLIKRQKLRQIALFFFLFAIMPYWACKKGPDFLKSYGSESTQFRNLNDFHTLVIGEKFRLWITQDTSKPASISISYGSNLLNGIKTKIKNGELIITDDNHYNWVRDMKVFPVCTLNIHNIHRIRALGACQIKCLDTLNLKKLDITMDGVNSHELLLNCETLTGACSNAGNIVFKGYAGLFAWSCENGGWMNASEMKSSDVYIFHYSNRDISLNPSTILKAYVYGKGNVYYYEEPWYVLVKEEFGQGKVIKKQ